MYVHVPHRHQVVPHRHQVVHHRHQVVPHRHKVVPHRHQVVHPRHEVEQHLLHHVEKTSTENIFRTRNGFCYPNQ